MASKGELSFEGAVASMKKDLTFNGEVLTPEDGAAFASSFHMWNKLHMRTPSVVIKPRGTWDVQRAVKIASDFKCEVAVKGGAHGRGAVDGGVLIDMSLMRGVVVDPVEKTAIAQGGCTLGDLDKETSVYNLMIPLGHYSGTGMGLVLGGGLGVSARKFGLSSDSVLSYTFVVADGRVVTVTKESDEDLFWACHGAGANFGVLVSVKFRCYPTDHFYGGMIIYPHSAYKEVATWIRDVGKKDRDFCAMLMMARHPELGDIVGAALHHWGEDKTREEKSAFMAPLRKIGPPLVDTTEVFNYFTTQDFATAMLGMWPHVATYWTLGRMEEVTDDFLEDYVKVKEATPAKAVPFSLYILDLQGGDGYEKQAYGPLYTSHCKWSWYFIVGWENHPEDTEECTKHARAMKAKLAQYTTTLDPYGNMETEKGEEDVGMTGGLSQLERLTGVKRRWDPTNLFHINHNVKA